jgi:hypothetical protein
MVQDKTYPQVEGCGVGVRKGRHLTVTAGVPYGEEAIAAPFPSGACVSLPGTLSDRRSK